MCIILWGSTVTKEVQENLGYSLANKYKIPLETIVTLGYVLNSYYTINDKALVLALTVLTRTHCAVLQINYHNLYQRLSIFVSELPDLEYVLLLWLLLYYLPYASFLLQSYLCSCNNTIS